MMTSYPRYYETIPSCPQILLRGDPFLTFAERGRGRVPKNERSK